MIGEESYDDLCYVRFRVDLAKSPGHTAEVIQPRTNR